MTTGGTNWKNVNNWHWQERDVWEWTRAYLGTDRGSGPLTMTNVHDIKGDAVVSQRKGRLKIICDISFTADIMREGEKVAVVTVSDYMADDALSDFDCKISPSVDGAKEMVWNVLEAYKAEGLQTHGSSLLVTTDPETHHKPEGVVEMPKEAIRSGAIAGFITDVLTCNVDFLAAPSDIYAALCDAQRIAAWSRGGQLNPDGTFTLYGGNVSGRIPEKIENKLIKMDWRLSSWPPEHHSKVHIELRDDGGRGTEVILTQQGVPASQMEETRSNWQNYYWTPIRCTFGYGPF